MNGWHHLDCGRPWYSHPVGSGVPDGEYRTVVLAVDADRVWLWRRGMHTNSGSPYTAIYQAQGGEWVAVWNSDSVEETA